MKIERVAQQTVVSQIMHQVRDLVASGQLGPGDKLPTEQELAAMFGTSRSSIREAIRVFHNLGILESRTKRGTFLKDSHSIATESLIWAILLSKKETNDLLELRAAMEVWSGVELTSRYATGHHRAVSSLETLEKTILGMKIAIAKNRREDLIRADYEFHRAIIQGTKESNSMFESVYKVLEAFLLQEISYTYIDLQDTGSIPDKHSKILDAISSGDTCLAMQAIREHLLTVQQRVQRVMDLRLQDRG